MEIITKFETGNGKNIKRIRKNFIVDIIPYSNPDGAYLGKPRTNAQGIDLHREANPEKKPVAVEVSKFWQWIEQHPAFLYINLHGFECI